MTSLSNRILLTGQVAGGIVALAAMTFYPPARGRILMIPLAEHDAGAAPRAALVAGAALLGRGPLRGSWVVMGERARIAAHVHGWHMLLLAAPPAGCSGDRRAVTA